MYGIYLYQIISPAGRLERPAAAAAHLGLRLDILAAGRWKVVKFFLNLKLVSKQAGQLQRAGHALETGYIGNGLHHSAQAGANARQMTGGQAEADEEADEVEEEEEAAREAATRLHQLARR